VREFGTKAAAFSALSLLGFAFSGVGGYVLRNWIGVGDQLIWPALLMLGVLSVSPFTVLVSELCTGVLLSRSDSASIGGGRTVYVITLTVAVLAAALAFPQLNAIVAPIGMLVGAACESLFLWTRARRPVGAQYPGLLPFGG
jgi:hypothetical protein